MVGRPGVCAIKSEQEEKKRKTLEPYLSGSRKVYLFLLLSTRFLVVFYRFGSFSSLLSHIFCFCFLPLFLPFLILPSLASLPCRIGPVSSTYHMQLMTWPGGDGALPDTDSP